MPIGIFPGNSPLVLSFPYAGTQVPRQLRNRMTPEGLELRDGDQALADLMEGFSKGSTRVRANFSRYLADMNAEPVARGSAWHSRPDMVTYQDSRGARVWNGPPSRSEMSSWQSAFRVPYHAVLAAHIARVRARNGFAVVCDCVIRRGSSPAPRDVTVSTVVGTSCDTMLASNLVARLNELGTCSAGYHAARAPGWTLRNYGKPKSGVHALQLQIAPEAILKDVSDPITSDPGKAAMLVPMLFAAVDFLATWQPSRSPAAVQHA